MSGLLALLDDVAAIAKIAATSVDDIASAAAKTTAKVAGGVIDDAAKAGAKAAGAVIDDAAVTPKYMQGFPAARELPIVGRIAMGSIRNKLLILLPAALLLDTFAPWAIAPLLLLGGLYLCFEGAEKVHHWLSPGAHGHANAKTELADAHLEEKRIKGAIKTDFILSAEIMTIALSAIPEGGVMMTGLTLALVAVMITVAVYGAVALIVKADDVGLAMAAKGRLGLTRSLGRSIVRGMPFFMQLLMVVGTLAMLWVGGSIVVHALEEMGFALPAHLIHDIAVSVAHAVPSAEGAVEWGVTALIDGVIGLALGFLLIPIANKVLSPVIALFGGDKAPEGH